MRRALRRFTHWLVRLLLRVGLLPASTRADSDTMGEWKRLMAEKDDPRPGLVLPDPNAPYADLIRRVRLYAQNGAKALAPWLDAPLPVCEDGTADNEAMAERLLSLEQALRDDGDAEGLRLLLDLNEDGWWQYARARIVHAAYNSPWTVVDGEVYEYESERKRRVVQ